MDTWAAELEHRLEALEIDASLHTPAQDEENSDEEQPKVVQATEVVARYEEALRRLAGDVDRLPVILEDESQKPGAKETVCRLVLTLSAHLGKHYWTSPSSRLQARGVLDRVIAACGCSSTLELLIGRPESHDTPHDSHMTSPYVSMATKAEETAESRGPNSIASIDNEAVGREREKDGGRDNNMVFRGGVIKSLLLLLRSRLTAESWKKQPTAKHALIWTLRQLKHPHLSPHINSFLPPLLMLVDDHESYHKTLGLSGLTHLISNTDPTELRWYGRADVIYEAIKSMLYMREEAIIHSLHSCLIILLPVIEGPPTTTVTMPTKPTRTDEVFRILLNNIDMESKITLRKAYVGYVGSYIDLLGIYTARHIKVYSGTPVIWTPMGQKKVSILVRCPYFRG
ncbi:TELO2-interacting protein 2 [Geodia barretti]|uniref:TELO2-interacting protein 2 n=1 Tax=Geodia barretti TaxID=519541 RepID=A0AA35S0M4_GEOBA|nr:TELO2-interacting protein 2 [Geodia barretti]